MKPVYTPNRPMCEITQGFLFDTMDTMNYHNFTSRVRLYTKSLCDFIDAAAATGQIYHANQGSAKARGGGEDTKSPQAPPRLQSDSLASLASTAAVPSSSRCLAPIACATRASANCASRCSPPGASETTTLESPVESSLSDL